MIQEQPNEMAIDLSEEIAQGLYVNFAVISHSTSEFVVDFIRIMPNVPKPRVQSRVILAPEHAKRLMMALEDNIMKYEAINGEIRIPGEQDDFIPPIISSGGQA